MKTPRAGGDHPRPAAFPSSVSLALLQLHRPVGVVEERLPGLVLALRQLEVEDRAALRLLRLADQAQVRLLGRAAALADVAGHAGADDVLPGRAAALTARHDVV